MVLYPIRYAKEGRKVGEFPVGTIDWVDGQLSLDVPDKKLRQKIEDLLGQPLSIRIPRGRPETVLGHGWQQLPPGTERHYMEALQRLLRLDLVARPI